MHNVVKTDRGLTREEMNDLESLSMFLEDYQVKDVDVEPYGDKPGYRITCKDVQGKTRYSGWGNSIRTAVESVVRSVSAGR